MCTLNVRRTTETGNPQESHSFPKHEQALLAGEQERCKTKRDDVVKEAHETVSTTLRELKQRSSTGLAVEVPDTQLGWELGKRLQSSHRNIPIIPVPVSKSVHP